eukprot:2015289-Amphidinium_carterae.1
MKGVLKALIAQLKLSSTEETCPKNGLSLSIFHPPRTGSHSRILPSLPPSVKQKPDNRYHSNQKEN